MITGYVYGVQSGFITGAMAALVSNVFLGQGPWTPWQMLAWGICGIMGGLTGKGRKGYAQAAFPILTAAGGVVFSLIMNIWNWAAFIYPLNWKTFAATYISSLPFDALHVAGNLAFAVFLGQPFYNILMRYKKYLA